MPRVAVCQMSSGPALAENLDQAVALLKAAAAAGATFAALPENFERMASAEEKRAGASALDGPVLAPLRAAARSLGIWVLAGSFAEARVAKASPTPPLEPTAQPTPDIRVHNTSALIDPDGNVAAIYRKIHLFDAEVGDGVAYRESALVAPGDTLAVAETPFGQLGLSICYDLRFPELYRSLVQLGAELFAVPAAFTETTGRDHWEVLLRARAIENQCFVLAPAQTGSHPGDRHTHGHALIVDPWGKLLADAGTAIGIATAEVDLDQLRKLRRRMPVLAHRRL